MKQHQLCFETLANGLRLEILNLLKKEPMNVTQLAKATSAERSNVSHSLQMLRGCHFVKGEKKGREVIYSLNAESPILKQQKGNLFTIMKTHASCHCETCHKHGCSPEFGKEL